MIDKNYKHCLIQ